MKQTRLLMGMPVTIEIVDPGDPAATAKAIDEIYDYFVYIDEKFSTYKTTSEISAINDGRLTLAQSSQDMQTIFALSEETKTLSDGYFDIRHKGHFDPSGIVKGWAIFNAADLLRQKGFRNYYVDAGGDVQVAGRNEQGELWRIGIRNPFNMQEIVKVVCVDGLGVATSGTYIRGQHIYNPLAKQDEPLTEVLSLTVIGPNIYEADRFATAAFAMGRHGIVFIEELTDFEGYMIDSNGIATLTTGFEGYVCHD